MIRFRTLLFSLGAFAASAEIDRRKALADRGRCNYSLPGNDPVLRSWKETRKPSFRIVPDGKTWIIVEQIPIQEESTGIGCLVKKPPIGDEDKTEKFSLKQEKIMNGRIIH